MVTENLIKNKEPILDESEKPRIKDKVSEWYKDVYLKPRVTESKSYVHEGDTKIRDYISKLNNKEAEEKEKKGGPIGKSGAKPLFYKE